MESEKIKNNKQSEGGLTFSFKVSGIRPLKRKREQSPITIARTVDVFMPVQPETNQTLQRCSSFIGMSLLDGNSNKKPASSLISKTDSGTKKCNEKKINTMKSSTPQKSSRAKHSMPMDRLRRMEAAVQQWNTNFGTFYTLLS